jgi:hypothetical protein
VSLRDTVGRLGRFPASELAGYFQWSLRDFLHRCAPPVFQRCIPNYPHTYRGSYSTLCFFKNATNSSSKLRLR